jgi:hypothetical protein
MRSTILAQPMCSRLIIVLALSVWMSRIAPVVAIDSFDPNSIVRSVYRVVVTPNLGTGFAIAPTILATNFHVIANPDRTVPAASTIRVIQGTRGWQVARVIWSDQSIDLALLEVPELHAVPLPIAVAPLERLQRVVAVGYPGSADRPFAGQADGGPTTTDGSIGRLISTPRREEIQHGAHVAAGNSGGPLIDVCGRVVGINTHVAGTRVEGVGAPTIIQTPGVYFAVSAKHLYDAAMRFAIPITSHASACQSPVPNASAIQIEIERWRQMGDQARQQIEYFRQEQDQLRRQGGADRQQLALAERRIQQAESQLAAARQRVEELQAELSRIADSRKREIVLFTLISGGGTAIAGLALAIALRRSRRQLIRAVDVSSRFLTGHSLRLPSATRRGHLPRWRIDGRTHDGKAVSIEIDNDNDRVVVGRSRRLADVVVEDSSLSRRHARLRLRDHRLEIEDLNSNNGVYLNKRRIEKVEPIPISAGDTLRLGNLHLVVTGTQAGDGASLGNVSPWT